MAYALTAADTLTLRGALLPALCISYPRINTRSTESGFLYSELCSVLTYLANMALLAIIFAFIKLDCSVSNSDKKAIDSSAQELFQAKAFANPI